MAHSGENLLKIAIFTDTQQIAVFHWTADQKFIFLGHPVV